MRQITEVISTKRSAHHAFIGWFCANARRPIAFFNNVIPSSPPRLRELERYRGGVGATAPAAADHVNELLEGTTDVLMNFEGKMPSSIERWNDRYLRPNLNGHAGSRLVRLVFLRDPVNTLASMARRCRPSEFRSLFKYFYQVVALEEIISRISQTGARFCEKIVLMSPWLRNESYRNDVARFFDLDPGLPPAEVTRQGGGSSFGGMKYDPSKDSAMLGERWRAVDGNALFLAAFADTQTAEAARTYFRLFGEYESIDPGVIDALEQRARADEGANDYVRRVLVPMRRARGSLGAMEFAPQPAIRELWKGVITTRMMLRI